MTPDTRHERALFFLRGAALVVALAVGAFGERVLHQGVELRMIVLAGLAPILVAIDSLAFALGVKRRAWLGHPLAVGSACALAVSAIWIYPIPRGGSWAVLGWALAALFVEAPSRREIATKDAAESQAIARSRVVIRLGVLVASALSFLVLAEIALRVRGTFKTWLELNGNAYQSPYTWRPFYSEPFLFVEAPHKAYSQSQPEFSFEITTNADGLRDVEHPVDKPAGEYRVVGLGDSFVMGQGAAFEDTCFQQLERRLNSVAREKTCRSIVGGVAGSDPVFEYFLLEKRLVRYSPDVVVMCINGSDIGDAITRGGMDRFEADGRIKEREAPWFEPIFARSHLVRALLLRGLGYDWNLIGPAQMAEAHRKAACAICDAIDATRALGQKRGFETLVVLTPFRYNVEDSDKPEDLAPLREVMTERHMAFTDLLGLFRREVPKDRIPEFFWRRDQHFTKKGYELMARGIEEELLKVASFPKAR